MYLDELYKARGKERGFYTKLHRLIDVSWGTVMRAARREPIQERKAQLISAATGGKVTVAELTAPNCAPRPIKHRRKARRAAA